MALTRKMLQAMDIPAEKIDEIINAHTETINALKDERDNAQKELAGLKEKSGNLESVTKELEKTKADLEKAVEWEKKYKDTKAEYDSYKSDTEAKATRAKKEQAYKQLLVDAGVSAKRIDSVLKISADAINGVEFDNDGKIKDADKLTESVKKEWADFIQTVGQRGAEVPNPAGNDGEGMKPKSRAAQLTAQYRNEHYGSIKED